LSSSSPDSEVATTLSLTKNNIQQHQQRQQYSIVCGTNDGTLYVQSINQRIDNGEIDFDNPFSNTGQQKQQKQQGQLQQTKVIGTTTIRKMMPNHLGGAVKYIQRMFYINSNKNIVEVRIFFSCFLITNYKY
jgi:hypothetical protein